MVDIRDGASYAPTSQAEQVVGPGEFVFAAAFLDHGHIYGQVNGLRDAGATLKWVYEPDEARRALFCAKFPEAQVAESYEQILSDPQVRLVTAAAIPDRRAAIGHQAMRAGKHYFTDKSPFTTLDQLAETRRVIADTGLKYMVYYAERLHNDAAWHAGEMIAAGAIGDVVQVLILAPHRMARETRPGWFFEKQAYGGILTDIGSHQVEQFLTFSGARSAEITHARVANLTCPEHPGMEDFGEMAMTGDNGASFYARVDWLTPQGLRVWGDGRTFITGTRGTMELRKYIELGGDAPVSTIYLVNGDGEQVILCQGRTGFPFFGRLIRDCMDGTDTAMTQEHALLAAELSMQAQEMADRANG